MRRGIYDDDHEAFRRRIWDLAADHELAPLQWDTDPQVDVGWWRGDRLVVVEVKSTLGGNECSQLRLGLGQVMDYRQQLGGDGVDAWVAVSQPLTDLARSREVGASANVGVGVPSFHASSQPSHS